MDFRLYSDGLCGPDQEGAATTLSVRQYKSPGAGRTWSRSARRNERNTHMAEAPAPQQYPSPYSCRSGRLRVGAAVSAALALAVAGLVSVPAPVPGALAVTSAGEVLGAGHETLASVPLALRRAVEPLLGPDGPAQLGTGYSPSGARLGTTSGTWALGLGSVGRPGALRAVPETKPSRQGNETVYHSAGLTEWFKDQRGGTEQGFTIAERPAGAGPLVIALSVPGLTAHYGAGGALVLRQGSRAVLGYGGLSVRDATGSPVPARLVPAGSALHIVVDDAKATYPLYVDPTWSQQAELTATDGGANDQFGNSVAISGSTALIGAPYHEVGSDPGQGAVYVFTYAAGNWSQQAELTATDGGANDQFGYSVAISGTTALIGAYNHEVGSDTYEGAAYVFTYSGSAWSQQAELTAADGAAYDLFGCSVSLSGTTALIGAPYHEVGSNTYQGAAYVFTYSGGTWSQQAELTATDGAVNDQFGGSVSLSATTALIGAPGHEVGSNADQGAAYVFTYSGGTWSQQAELTATDGAHHDQFGTSVSLSGTTALIGAPGHEVGSHADQGAAYVLTYSGANWYEQAELTPTDGAASDQFGYSVSISGTTALIGANGQEVGSDPGQGAAYVFTSFGSAWSQQAALTASDGTFSNFFGTSVSLSGTTALIGAFGHQVGSNLHQGAAYAFQASSAPTVSSVSPSSGPVAGATTVDVTGTGFVVGSTTASFGATAAGVSCSSTTACTATSPAEPAGTVDITLTTPGGTSATSPADQFTFAAAPSVSAINPDAGPVAGGTAVALTGTGFLVGGTTASFGGTAATAFSCTSSTSCTATSPAGVAGTVDITVTTLDGTSATSPADQFSYQAAPLAPAPTAGPAPSSPTYSVPTISSLSPGRGPVGGGTVIDVTGTGFVVGSTSVSFGGTAGSIICTSSTSCTATTPAHPAGAVDVALSTPGGTSALGRADEFSFMSPSTPGRPAPPAPLKAPVAPGYWTVTAAGLVSADGSARSHGSVKNEVGAVVGIAAVPGGTGYWAVTSAGRVYSYGSACYHGSVKVPLGPVVGMASAPKGSGYWAVTSAGRVYSFGSARYHGGVDNPAAGIVGMAASPTGSGYWLVSAKGKVYAFGSAQGYGPAAKAVGDVVGITSTPTGSGYWLVTAAGRVYAFGSARYYGGEAPTSRRAVAGITAAPGGTGYWLAGTDGAVYGFGSAASVGLGGTAPRAGTTVVGIAGS